MKMVPKPASSTSQSSLMPSCTATLRRVACPPWSPVVPTMPATAARPSACTARSKARTAEVVVDAQRPEHRRGGCAPRLGPGQLRSAIVGRASEQPTVGVVHHVVVVATPHPTERDEREQPVASIDIRLEPVQRGADVEEVATDEIDDVPCRLAGVDPLELGDPPVRRERHATPTAHAASRRGRGRTGGSSPAADTGSRCDRDDRRGRRPARGSCRRVDRARRAPTTRRRRRSSTTECLGEAEPERPGAHRQAPQQPTLVVVEQVVAPRHRRQQGLLARQRRPSAAGEKPEPFVQPTQRCAPEPAAGTGRRQARWPAGCRRAGDTSPPPPPSARASSVSSGRTRRARSRNNVIGVVAVEPSDIGTGAVGPTATAPAT